MENQTMKPKVAIALFGILLLAGLLISGCDRLRAIKPQVRNNWIGSSLFGKMEYKYSYFSGTEQKRFQVDNGQQIEVNYQATVDEGTLTLQLLDQDQKVVWNQSLKDDAEDTIVLQDNEGGNYLIQVIGDGTSGNFKLTWNVYQ